MILLRKATLDDCVKGRLVWFEEDPCLFMRIVEDPIDPSDGYFEDPIVEIVYSYAPSEDEWVRLSELGVLVE
jgi:hypothetical protein